MLLLSFWHAPIPWVHAHDLTGPVAERVASLHRHIDTFHAAQVEHGERHLDLHAHLVLPWGRQYDSEPAPGDRHGSETDDVDFLVRYGGAPTGSSQTHIGQPTDRAFGSPHAAAGLYAAERSVLSNAPLFSLSHGRHFFETFGRAVSIRDLLGVRLC